jgi:hypothetical protein
VLPNACRDENGDVITSVITMMILLEIQMMVGMIMKNFSDQLSDGEDPDRMQIFDVFPEDVEGDSPNG